MLLPPPLPPPLPFPLPCPTALTRAHLVMMGIPGQPRVLQMSQSCVEVGGVRMPVSYFFNVSMTASAFLAPSLSQEHPGFTLRPLSWCMPMSESRPLTSLRMFFINNSSQLTDMLLISLPVLERNWLSTSSALPSFPITVIFPQSVAITDLLAELAKSSAATSPSSPASASVTLPLMLMGPAFPYQVGQAVPGDVTLDLTGCIGCISLSSFQAQVYITGIHLSGLEPLDPSTSSMATNGSNSGSSSSNSSSWGSGSSSSNGSSWGSGSSSSNSSVNGSGSSNDTSVATGLALPLWAFQFSRSPGNQSVHLHNVSLTLPVAEFRWLLDSLTGGLLSDRQQQQVPVGHSVTLFPDLYLKVGGWLAGWLAGWLGEWLGEWWWLVIAGWVGGWWWCGWWVVGGWWCGCRWVAGGVVVGRWVVGWVAGGLAVVVWLLVGGWLGGWMVWLLVGGGVVVGWWVAGWLGGSGVVVGWLVGW